MEQRVLGFLLSAAILVPGATAAGQRNFARLRAGLVPTQDGAEQVQLLQARVDEAAAGLFTFIHPKVEVSKKKQGESVSVAQSNKGNGTKQQPVQIQAHLAQEDIDKFTKKLNKDCAVQFNKTLEGKGSPLHKFDSTSDPAKDEAACEKLEGRLCSTHATITTTANQGGRAMSSVVNADGAGCVSSACTDKADLTQMAKFMHARALELLPASKAQLELIVDCTAGGGDSVTVSGSQ